ncbi:SPW repeat protein [Parapedobacter deserti]|uniref:SPW repeat protein n=1 Tax=Parapedobacter deserti TaxID=1912957 RepID=A0ABV7JSD4_9SPHI
MRFISRPIHAVLDYLSGIAMLVSPWVLNFADVTFARNVIVVSGVVVIIMSLITNYEGGISKKIAMSTHLWGDLFLGIFLAASPWLFLFNEETYIPHLAFGLLSIVASLLTVNTSLVKRHIPVDFVYKR